MCDKSNRSKSCIIVKQLFDHLIILDQSNKHDHSSLTMSNVIDLLKSSVMNILESSSKIISSHFIKTELPELFIISRQTMMFSTVIVTSHISKPYIEPSIGEIESRSKIIDRSRIHDPTIRTINKPMLQIHHRQPFFKLCLIFFLQPIISENVSIFC